MIQNGKMHYFYQITKHFFFKGCRLVGFDALCFFQTQETQLAIKFLEHPHQDNDKHFADRLDARTDRKTNAIRDGVKIFVNLFVQGDVKMLHYGMKVGAGGTRSKGFRGKRRRWKWGNGGGRRGIFLA